MHLARLSKVRRHGRRDVRLSAGRVDRMLLRRERVVWLTRGRCRGGEWEGRIGGIGECAARDRCGRSARGAGELLAFGVRVVKLTMRRNGDVRWREWLGIVSRLVLWWSHPDSLEWGCGWGLEAGRLMISSLHRPLRSMGGVGERSDQCEAKKESSATIGGGKRSSASDGEHHCGFSTNLDRSARAIRSVRCALFGIVSQ
jgi:hypothetical protein